MKHAYDCDVAVVTVVHSVMADQYIASVKRLIEHSSLDVQLVVVDHGAGEFDTRALVQAEIPEAIVILRNGNFGFGSSTNRGVREVHARYYFILNPDTQFDDPMIVDRLYAFMQKYPRVGMTAPKVLYMDGRLQETCRRFPSFFMPVLQRLGLKAPWAARRRDAFMMEDYDHNAPRMVDWVQGSVMMVDGDLYREVGGFDARYFMYVEDIDLCREFWHRGRPIYYLPDVEVKHVYGKGSSAKGNPIMALFTNKLAQAHVASWLRYMLKWRGKAL